MLDNVTVGLWSEVPAGVGQTTQQQLAVIVADDDYAGHC